jgi:putative ABC transport system ATP-binding protein
VSAAPSLSPRPLVSARDVTMTYGAGALATPVLHGVSLDLHAGELTLVMGPSGSGKTTLISILAGLLRATSGTVELCGADVSRATEAQAARVRREHVGFVFQQYNLFPALSALENVAAVLRMKGDKPPVAAEKARAALERVGLGQRAHHKPRELSGGQQQRVAIARALAGGPTLLIGDEVTGALDGATALDVMGVLRGHVGPRTAVVIVTHDHRLERFAERVIELEDGRVMRDRRTGGAS